MRNPAQLLDDPGFINQYDKGKILESAYLFPDQCRQAWEESFEVITPASCYLVGNIVFSGMGGSALPGRIIDSLGQTILRIPFEVYTSYHLPSYVSPKTLVILASYSGNTEETLTALSEAREKGAQIFCLTSGGQMKELAQTYSLPGYFFTPRFNPSGQPRMGAGYPLMGSLGLLSRCQLLRFGEDQATSIIRFLREQSGSFLPNIPARENPAKLLAESLHGKIVILVSSGHLLGSVHAVKNMFNENAKTFSTLFDLPELNHHLLEGLQFPALNRDQLVFLFFESQSFHPEIKKRFRITRDVVAKHGISHYTYQTRGGKVYSEAFELVHLGGFLSFYMAALNNIEPTAIPWVDYFKEQMKKQ